MKIKKLTALLLAATMTIAMAVPAAADTYVASVEAKDAPTVNNVTSSDGTTTYNTGYLTVTPLSQADESTTDTTVAQSLNDAYAEIKAATTVNDLVDVTDVLSTYNTANSTNYVAADLTVTDLFYISASGSIATALASGSKVSVTLSVDSVSADDLVIVLQYADGTWVVLEDYVVNSDGTITVTIDKECTLAIVTATEEAAAVGGTGTTSSTTTETTSSSESTTTTDETTSPQTGETMNYGLIAMAAVLAFGAAICFGTGKKRA